MNQDKDKGFLSKEELIEIWKKCESSQNANKECDVYSFRFDIYDRIYIVSSLILYPPREIAITYNKRIGNKVKEVAINVGSHAPKVAELYCGGFRYPISEEVFNELREVWERKDFIEPVDNSKTLESYL